MCIVHINLNVYLYTAVLLFHLTRWEKMWTFHINQAEVRRDYLEVIHMKLYVGTS